MPPAAILVVDDEKNIRLLLQELLVEEGHRVLTADTGQTALTLIGQNPVDLILLDLKMPGGLDGMQVLSALRRQGAAADVIILTAHATLETAVEALRQGAFDYLLKPIAPEQFLDSVRRGLEMHQKKVRQQALIDQLGQVTNGLAQLQAPAVVAQTAPADKPAKAPASKPELTSERLLKYGPFVIDRIRQVSTADGYLLDLSRTEYDLLAYLVQQAPQIVSPTEIVQAVQDYHVDAWQAGNIVRQHIYHIRRKIQIAGGNPDAIHTVRGKGYAIIP
jgi:DNA-binding response OmpR family regulator